MKAGTEGAGIERKEGARLGKGEAIDWNGS